MSQCVCIITCNDANLHNSRVMRKSVCILFKMHRKEQKQGFSKETSKVICIIHLISHDWCSLSHCPSKESLHALQMANDASYANLGKCQPKIIMLCDWCFETKVIIVGDSFFRKPISIV